jgi:hypothetical protein
MSREVDRRTTDGGALQREPAAFASAVAEASRNLPGDQRVRIDRMDSRTGNPATLAVEEAPAEEGN